MLGDRRGGPDLNPHPSVIAELDRLLDDPTDAEIVDILNARGMQPGVADRFTLRIEYTCGATTSSRTASPGCAGGGC